MKKIYHIGFESISLKRIYMQLRGCLGNDISVKIDESGIISASSHFLPKEIRFFVEIRSPNSWHENIILKIYDPTGLNLYFNQNTTWGVYTKIKLFLFIHEFPGLAHQNCGRCSKWKNWSWSFFIQNGKDLQPMK